MMAGHWHDVMNHLWQSTLFAACAGIVTVIVAKNRARVRSWIWLTASVKFLVPFSVFVGAGSHLRQQNPSLILAPIGVSGVIETVTFPFAEPAAFTAMHGQQASFNWISTIACAVWATGFATLVYSWLLRWLRIRAAVRAATVLPLELDIEVRTSTAFGEPGVWGLHQPILLLPEGITERLKPHHLAGIVAHELCHVRRRDNLATTIHMIVEVVFWFHPLVWWLGARLIDERERACDEEVLLMGIEPQSYAEGILKICELYLESPLQCVAGVTGGNLKVRIEAIMMNRIGRDLGFMKRLALTGSALAVLAAPAVIGVIQAPAVRAQPMNQLVARQAFEVASIKPTRPDNLTLSVRPYPGGRVVAQGATLKFLIQWAYQIMDFQVSGASGWMDSERFDIEAKAAGGGNPSDEMLATMLQTLLADRFKLILHRASSERPIYLLTVAKDGPKVPRASDPDCVPGPPGNCGGLRVSMGALNGPHVSIVTLARVLSFVLQRPVVDKTRLSGAFEVKLKWSPDRPMSIIPGEPTPAPTDPNIPEIFTALREQLGLQLEAQKGPIETLIIDSAQRPSGN